MPHRLQAEKKGIAKVTASQLFEQALPKAFEVFKEQAANIGATFQINIFGEGGGRWFVDPRNAKVERGAGEADCVLEMGVEEFTLLTSGKLNAKEAMTAGKMRFTGNPDHMIALGALLGG